MPAHRRAARGTLRRSDPQMVDAERERLSGAGDGDHDALRGALEELRPEVALERREPAPDRGVVDAQLARRRRECAGAGQLQEEPQVAPVGHREPQAAFLHDSIA